MTVGDVLERLEGLDENTPIRLALQPNYPMAGSLQNICFETDNAGDVKKVWFACSGNEDYGCPREAWEESEIDVDEDDED